MHVSVNGARIYVDIEGAGLVPDGPGMHSRPTLVLLHGGPGFDHSLFKPAFSELTDVAQIVYMDHRGNGRSSYGDPSTWNLAQWGDDVRDVCDALGIDKPIVYGVSFGGFVAQSYATHLARREIERRLSGHRATVCVQRRQERPPEGARKLGSGPAFPDERCVDGPGRQVFGAFADNQLKSGRPVWRHRV